MPMQKNLTRVSKGWTSIGRCSVVNFERRGESSSTMRCRCQCTPRYESKSRQEGQDCCRKDEGLERRGKNGIETRKGACAYFFLAASPALVFLTPRTFLARFLRSLRSFREAFSVFSARPTRTRRCLGSNFIESRES